MLYIVADDFGISAGVNQAIIELAKKKKLDGISCMLVFPDRKDSYQRLKNAQLTDIDLGLHITLTGKEIKPLAKIPKNSGLIDKEGHFHTWQRLCAKALLGQLDAFYVEQEIQAQLEAFTDLNQSLPKFVDSHHHIHQVPAISNSFIKMTKNLKKLNFVRCSSSYQSLTQRKSFIDHYLFQRLGKKFQQQALEHGLKTNDSLYTDFSSQPLKKRLQRRQLAKQSSNKRLELVAIHPGVKNDLQLKSRDPQTMNRYLDYLWAHKT